MEAARQEALGCWQLLDSNWDGLEMASQASILGRLIEYVEYDRAANAMAIRLKPGPLFSVVPKEEIGNMMASAS